MKKPEQWIDLIRRRARVLRKDWLDDADTAVKIYEADGEEVQFNILYSNTETLLPALYNSTPRPEVSRRYTQVGLDKSLDTAIASTAERLLEYFADSNDQEYETFDDAVREAVLQALVPGLGQVRVRYKNEGGYQQICFDSVPYDRFVWGYARKWSRVPWVAFGLDLTKEDFEKYFPDFAKTDEYKRFDWEALERDSSPYRVDSDKFDERSPAVLVWEVWSHEEKRIVFVCERFKSRFLLEEQFPFELSSRFPCPPPLVFVRRNANLTPKPPYELYRRQAEELNEVTYRLQKVLKAIKVRGGYNSAMQEIGDVLSKDDTELVPVNDVGSFTEHGGFEKNIWLLPIDKLIQVAQQLYTARAECKNVIYEIMGIADILRGSSVASETAKAQEIKNQWGTLRVKRMQKDVQAFCRTVFRIAFEFAANLFTPATVASITKLPYVTEAVKQQAMLAAQNQAADPQILAAASLPTWDQIIPLMRDRFERTYRIDVETNSTVDLEATEDKAAIAEFMNAWGQMMSGIVPLVESGAMPFEVAKLVMSEIFRRFRFARRVEQALDAIGPPQPKEDAKLIETRYQVQLEKAQADAKRQIGEMQETIIELTAALERERIKGEALRSEAALEKQGLEVAGKIRENELRNDYTGKMRLQQEQFGQKERKLRETVLRGELEALLKQHQQQMQGALAGVQKPLQESQTKFDEIMSLFAENARAIQALAQGQAGLMDAIREVARIAAADREAELFIGKDGRKRSRSRIVLS